MWIDTWRNVCIHNEKFESRTPTENLWLRKKLRHHETAEPGCRGVNPGSRVLVVHWKNTSEKVETRKLAQYSGLQLPEAQFIIKFP
jgi:hypothetical protein